MPTRPPPAFPDLAFGAPSARRPVAVTRLGRPLLGAPTGWDLVALSHRELIHVDPWSGTVTRTALPPMDSGDISFVPARGRVLVHPTDYRQGYVVADGRPAS